MRNPVQRKGVKRGLRLLAVQKKEIRRASQAFNDRKASRSV